MRYSIGLDIGITSVGYAVMELEEDDAPRRIIRLGARVFDVAENPKDGASLAKPRREARGMRRRLRRKSHRKARIRNLLVNEQIITQEQLDTLFSHKLKDIYELRCNALDRLITNEELARILLHLSQRRGFKSNRRGSTDDTEDGKLKKEMNENNALMKTNGYRTVGELFHLDARYSDRKRNKSDYINVVSRDMVLAEAHTIFSAQRNHGSTTCSLQLEEKYLDILSSQRAFDKGPGHGPPNAPSPYYSNDLIGDMVGDCTFEPGEKRAAKASYTFERFNLLQKINHIRIDGGATPQLNDSQRKRIIEAAHKTEKLTYVKIREAIDLPPFHRFNTVKYEKDPSTFDATEKKTKFEYLPAYHAMRKALNGISPNRINSIDITMRNTIGQVLSLYKDDEKITKHLSDAGINILDINELISKSINFRGFGHLSVKALDKILPYMEQGLNYHDACTKASYNFKADDEQEVKQTISLEHLAKEAEKSITSPVVRRAISQSAKVLNAIVREMGISPVYINIELARQMAKNFDERNEMNKSMTKNHEKNNRIKLQLQETFHNINPTGLDIVKFRLYEEQGGICLYSQSQMDVSRLFEDGYVDIDHIVPYSISFNDSYANKVLVLTSENRKKGDRLPLEYLSEKRQDNFKTLVKNINLPYAKKSRLLKTEITEDDRNQLHARALHDTQTMNRFLLNYLSSYLQFSPSSTRKRRVTAVNGAVTSMLRKRWGLSKIRENGDLHHAADAAIVACTTQGMIHKLSRHYKYRETRETDVSIDPRGHIDEPFPQPYPYFRDELMARLSQDNPSLAVERLNLFTYPENEIATLTPIFVSRMPSRKITGMAHEETIKGISETGKQIKKVLLNKLTLDKNGEIDRYYKPEADRLLYDALKTRLTQHGGDGKKAFPIDQAFFKPKGNGTPDRIIRSVKTEEKSTLNVPLHTPERKVKASADNGSMIRIDVFHIEGEGYYIVPIYVSDTVKPILRKKAIIAHKPYELWREMEEDNFIYSLYPNDLVYIKHKKSMKFSITHKESTLNKNMECYDCFAYYKTTSISTGAISIINHDNSYTIGSLGVKTLFLLEKYHVDVLGNYTKVKREKRQLFK